MWRCGNCGAIIEHGLACAVCGRLIDEGVEGIRRKVRVVRLRGNVANQRMGRGAKTGFVFGSILTLIFAGIFLVRPPISPPRPYPMLDLFTFVIVMGVSQAVILWPLLFAFA